VTEQKVKAASMGARYRQILCKKSQVPFSRLRALTRKYQAKKTLKVKHQLATF
jgi:hypothetical protein